MATTVAMKRKTIADRLSEQYDDAVRDFLPQIADDWTAEHEAMVKALGQLRRSWLLARAAAYGPRAQPGCPVTLRTLRDGCTLTQKGLGDLIGTHWGSIAAWEQGRSMPDAEAIRRLSLALAVSVDAVTDASYQSRYPAS